MRIVRKIAPPTTTTSATTIVIAQRMTLGRWSVTQPALLAAAWANLSCFRAWRVSVFTALGIPSSINLQRSFDLQAGPSG